MDAFRPIGVTLSGGGHRATLFGLGALLALVDAGVNKRVVQISSVSGGSITNAFVSLRCQFEEETSDSFDQIVKELANIVIHRGALTKPWIWAFFALVFGPVVLFVLAALGGVLPALHITLPLLIVWATLGLLRGWLVEALLAQRYFRHLLKGPRLRNLTAKSVEHIICCTDLARGVPCYFSSWNDGLLYLRKGKRLGRIFGDMFCAPNLPLAGAVRASVAFPGIPPRRVSLKRFRPIEKDKFAFGGKVKLPEIPPPKGTLYLSDGGIWNNLGTQALLEDNLFRGEQRGFHSEEPEILLVVNASANVERSPSWQFALPGWAELKSLLRVAFIQNENTVSPRVENLQRLLRQAIVEDKLPSSRNPKSIVIDISRKPDELFFDLRPALLQKTRHTPEYQKWAFDLVGNLSEKFYEEKCEGKEIDTSTLIDELRKRLLQQPPTQPDIEYKLLEDLETDRAYLQLCELANNLEQVGTTLDKIPKETGKTLIARGYVNTLTALYVFRIIGQGPDVFRKLTKERLEKLTS